MTGRNPWRPIRDERMGEVSKSDERRRTVARHVFADCWTALFVISPSDFGLRFAMVVTLTRKSRRWWCEFGQE